MFITAKNTLITFFAPVAHVFVVPKLNLGFGAAGVDWLLLPLLLIITDYNHRQIAKKNSMSCLHDVHDHQMHLADVEVGLVLAIQIQIQTQIQIQQISEPPGRSRSRIGSCSAAVYQTTCLFNGHTLS